VDGGLLDDLTFDFGARLAHFAQKVLSEQVESTGDGLSPGLRAGGGKFFIFPLDEAGPLL